MDAKKTFKINKNKLKSKQKIKTFFAFIFSCLEIAGLIVLLIKYQQ